MSDADDVDVDVDDINEEADRWSNNYFELETVIKDIRKLLNTITIFEKDVSRKKCTVIQLIHELLEKEGY